MKLNKKHKGESFESLMKRFRKSVEKSDILNEVKGREHYIKPSTTKKLAKEIAKIKKGFRKGGIMALDDQMNMFEEDDDMGLMQEGGDIDPVSGNEVPLGGTQEGVRDDVEANVSEGEMVIPEDVVRYIGLDKLMQLRQEAKMGLKKMEAMGQMGNSDEATMPDDLPFDMADLIIVSGTPQEDDEPKKMSQGGMAYQPSSYQGTQINPNFLLSSPLRMTLPIV